MNDYISLTELWSEPFDYIIDTCGASVAQGFVDRVNQIPVETLDHVIKCKNCKFWEYISDGAEYGMCTANHTLLVTERNGFCYKAEARNRGGKNN